MRPTLSPAITASHMAKWLAQELGVPKASLAERSMLLDFQRLGSWNAVEEAWRQRLNLPEVKP